MQAIIPPLRRPGSFGTPGRSVLRDPGPNLRDVIFQRGRSAFVTRDDNDRRSQLVFLTDRGRSVPPVTHAAAARIEERWAALTSPNEIEGLWQSLLKVFEAISADSV